MRGKRLAERQGRNRQLAQLDASNRCAYCRIEAVVKHQVFGDPRIYCSTDCADDQRVYDAVLAERRKLRALLLEKAK